MDAVRWITEEGEILSGVPERKDLMSRPGRLRLLDQTLLPDTLQYINTDDIAEIHDAIKRLVVRGAPAIGCAAALGLAAASWRLREDNIASFIRRVREMADFLSASRPTAVNLSWALSRCIKKLDVNNPQECSSVPPLILEEALAILGEDISMCRAIGMHGLGLIHDGATVLTHCNAGSLATGDYGTALAPVYAAHQRGVKVKVYSDETRPLLQGSRLTAWELRQAGIPVVTICDNMAGLVMREGKIDLVIVGSDRISANGDAANKIGTYSLAILANYHNVPFYVAAPYSTIDMSLEHGDLIPIEQRDPSEIRCAFGRPTAPENIEFYNPAFDVTPNSLISAIITERGIIRPPFADNLRSTFANF